MVHSVRGFGQPTHYEGVVTCMVRVPELPQRAPMWTAASWKTNGREKGGLVNQDISIFFMDSFRPPPCLYRSQRSSRSVLLSFSRPQPHDLLTFFNSLILFFASILANFHSFFQAVSCTYENIQFPQPRRISFLFIRVRGASQLGV